MSNICKCGNAFEPRYDTQQYCSFDCTFLISTFCERFRETISENGVERPWLREQVRDKMRGIVMNLYEDLKLQLDREEDLLNKAKSQKPKICPCGTEFMPSYRIAETQIYCSLPDCAALSEMNDKARTIHIDEAHWGV